MAIPARYPDKARAALGDLLGGLQEAEAPIEAVVVYGSLARGDYRPDHSDVNVAVVLGDASRRSLAKIRPSLRRAWHAAWVSPFVLTKAEIDRVTDAFPIKLADIQRCHDLIAGEDPFVDLAIDPEHFRLRTEQELRNHLLRLRRHYLRVGDDASALLEALYGSATSFAIELWALSRVTGDELTSNDRGRWLELAARRFDLDVGVLTRLGDIGRAEPIEARDASGLFFDVMDQVARAVALVDGAAP